MQLTRYTDLSLRVLMYLSYPDRSDLVTIAEIATQFDVPRNHLVKVVNRLVHLGWVSATRGRSGGIRLGVPAETLTLGQILREMEGTTALIDCEGEVCVLRNGCRLRGALADALQQFYRTLDGYTLAEICAAPTAGLIAQMHRLVAMPASAH
ncbi:Rrf2 family transcriptional regulator [Jeongeupia naejangsanensis]|uniref:Rrf2 family transcriptional regulator n=1 Tax=Jeongeupia naejangsanensis TaxID=613195 RepID=A0ABS2BJG0_9NEIS|nr:Rrf2 family transcriptional regulator [Jeongeupia naejangsanensis]MBM3115741.1 Rrf2 family transcriptional regulator [Jeongeupia naejangsanensis]